MTDNNGNGEIPIFLNNNIKFNIQKDWKKIAAHIDNVKTYLYIINILPIHTHQHPTPKKVCESIEWLEEYFKIH